MNPFENVIKPAQDTMQKFHIPASVTLAQWALESAFGRAMPVGSNNPFGIKAKKGQDAVLTWTHEVIHGNRRRVQAKFAKYASIEEAFEAHARVFYNGYYKAALSKLPDPDAFANALTGVYATDPQYGGKLISIMKKYNLYQYNEV